jgi:glycosyltransferase involved in cell wall biosynthesis
VDNGSTDGTPEIAAALGAIVLREPRRATAPPCTPG